MSAPESIPAAHAAGAETAKKPFRLFRRGPWENAATIIIACGVLMLMQPFSMTLYSWSFATTLTGTVMFVIVSKFKD